MRGTRLAETGWPACSGFLVVMIAVAGATRSPTEPKAPFTPSELSPDQRYPRPKAVTRPRNASCHPFAPGTSERSCVRLAPLVCCEYVATRANRSQASIRPRSIGDAEIHRKQNEAAIGAGLPAGLRGPAASGPPHLRVVPVAAGRHGVKSQPDCLSSRGEES